ncbi:radical SAM protein [Desulfallas sp. Bu1-1]|uniref:radical SAM protein n=1 Tax=Desulfallas sp. Bu1-1 TaxID=2787620 RepID=UPI00189F776B|nr:radical SAM protein [Desulfallas sp. Bu1-1]MBF7082581.1 radical SAM protein [Desulfallas sp. Bu1-1]
MSLAVSILGEAALKQVVKYVNRNPEEGLQSLLHWAGKIPFHPEVREKIEIGGRVFQDRDNNWYQLAMRIFKEVHPRVRERLIVNMFINAWFLGIPRQRELTAKTGTNIPFTLLVDPTARCNLRCTGCWAGDYNREQEMDYATLDRICSEAKALGIYFMVISGGEPLMRRNDLLALAAKYPDMAFHVYTNGTLIDDSLAEEVAKLGNIGFAISLEGFRESTDARRGRGVFDRVMKAMDTLRRAGVMFGFSATYTRRNAEEVGSEDFIELMIAKGCTFGWYFTYIPIGSDVDLELMATPKQRAYMYRQVQYFRKSKPIAVFDFWNDGELVQGCIAGGRRYLHINAAGEVEPCAFVHYATGNIKDMTLLEALNSPLMRAYRKRQPFNHNMLRPCPIIDNPDMLAEMVAESGAHPTQLASGGDAAEFAAALREYSHAWGRLADSLWEDGRPAEVEALGHIEMPLPDRGEDR